ncbi:hypothetical protein AB1Y20_022464 [Prymnesium parvum]|uniref:Chromo domain-containing protein n=1 Tax=Prymnesium parvum TaxID=97485 RepID=A0AB34JIW2_PRYPA
MRLNLRELQAILYCKDSVNKSTHNELKNKADTQKYVLELFPDLPEGVRVLMQAQQRRRNSVPRSMNSSSSGVSESEEIGEEEDEEEEQFDIDHFVAAGKSGRVVMLKVRWEGYASADDTWEPMSEIRKTQNERVEAFVATLKKQGMWPPANIVP